MNIHQLMREQMDLAATFAEDGAFHSAAQVLTNLSAQVKAHATKCDGHFADALAAVVGPAAQRAPTRGGA